MTDQLRSHARWLKSKVLVTRMTTRRRNPFVLTQG